MEAANHLQENNLALVHTNNELITEAPFEPDVVSTAKPFIEANTVEVSLEEIRDKHIIPVFIKDNEPVISHVDFIHTTRDVLSEMYYEERILKPSIRVSHPIKGRIPEAKLKPACELLEHEKTLYYERMAFIIEIPTVSREIEGNTITLCVGGVKAHNLDNLYNKKGADQHFKVFIGFKNTVCTNLCVWSDGFVSDLKVMTLGQLKACIRTLFENYNGVYQMQQLADLAEYSITEHQFALLIGKCRIYNFIGGRFKKYFPGLSLGDSQMNLVCKDYYTDESTCKDGFGNINLWKLYNLFTAANKSTYIDNFLDRSVNAFHFVEEIKRSIQKKEYNWFLQ
jgi:hypothetical protein